MNTGDSIREFFNSLIGEGPGKRFASNAEMARFLGLKTSTATTLFNFLKGAKTQYAYVAEWFEKLGGHIMMPDQALDGFVFVHRIKAIAGAGESLEVDSEIEASYAFRESFFKYLGINHKHVKMMFVRGDSMQPLINDRDMIMFDEKDTEVREGYIYVIGYDGALMVKRLQRISNGWNICSENPSYSPVPVQGDEQNKLRIFGRVRWFGRVV